MTSAAARRVAGRARRRLITDEEIGVVASTMDEPRAVVAQMIDRSTQMVGVIRRIVKNGDPRDLRKWWTEEEDELLMSLEGPLYEEWVRQHFPSRTWAAVANRRYILGHPARLGIGDRTVVALTCTDCGQFRAGEWFNGRARHCRECAVVKSRRYEDNEDRDRRSAIYRELAQEVTSKLATRHGLEYTTEDEQVLANRELNDLEKAIRLKRTFVAVANARRRRRYESSFVRLEDLDFGQWVIRAKGVAA